MPQVAVAVAVAFMEGAAAIIGTGAAAVAVTGAVANGILALGGAMGMASFVSAWGTVASFASLAMTPRVSASNSGGPVSLQLDVDAPCPIALGRTAVGGKVGYRATFGTSNRFLGMMAILSIAGPCQDIEGHYANGYATAFAGTPPEETGTFVDFMWQYEKLGDTPETAFAFTAADWDGEIPPGWTTAHKLSGMAKIFNIYRWKGDAKNPRYPSGVPKQYTVGKWVKCYDPRADSTYPGGSGAQRLATPSTWGWTENPYVVALQWLIGWTANSVRVAGCGVPLASIDVAAFVAGANIADANGWTVGGVVTTADDKWEVLAAILQAGGGSPVSLGAMVSCLVKTPQTSTITLTAADVVGDPEVVNTLPFRARFNRVIPKVRSEDHDWQVVAGGAISVAAYLTADGSVRRTREVSLPLVQDFDQGAQLAYYDLADTREVGPFTIPCGPRMLNARVGACMTVQLPEIGYASQKCIVVGREHDPSGLRCTLTLRGETDAKHALALAQTGTPPPDPSIVHNDPLVMDTPAAGDWTVSGTTIGNGTDSLPAIVITGACTNDTARSVLFEYKKAADSVWIAWPLQSADMLRLEIIGLAGGTSYDVRSYYVNEHGTYSATPRTEGPVTTGTAAVTPPTGYEPPLPPGYTPETSQDPWVSGPNPDVIAF